MLPIIHHPAYRAVIPDRHRFPMGKFEMLMKLLRDEGLARDDNTFEPVPAPASWLSLAHDQTYVDQVLNGDVPGKIARDIGFPMNPSVCLRARCATAGTVLAGRLALEHGIACNTAGGSHHARHAQGAGFCVFNDVAVAVRVLQAEGLAERILIIDLDVHQGDGTAEIFAHENDVFTLSVHAERNYPTNKMTSDLDIGLPDETGDTAYLSIIEEVVPKLLDEGAPDIVFYNAGVDPHAEDRLGRLALSTAGLYARDELVIGACKAREIPLACAIGGGYSYDVPAIADRHAILHRTATRLYAP